MFETVKWAFSRRRRIKQMCYDVWGQCKAKNKMWKNMTRAEKREVKTAAADIIDMRDYLDDVYEFIRGVGDCAVRKNPRKITDAKLRLKGVINCVNDIEIKDLIN